MRSAWLWFFPVTSLLTATLYAQNRCGGNNDQQAQEAIQKFQEAIRKQNLTDDEKIEAVKDLAKVKHARVLATLVPLINSGSIPVRIVAARELSGFAAVRSTPRKLMESYVSASNKSPEARGVKITILRALGDIRAKEAVDFVNVLVGDKEDWIAKAAIDAAGKIRHKSSIEKLLKEYARLEGKDGDTVLSLDPLDSSVPYLPSSPKDIIGHIILGSTEKHSEPAAPKTRRDLLIPALNEALKSITKQSFTDRKSWDDWWAKNGARFKVAD